MPVSIKGVAHRAGVSPSTVSKVLNNAPEFSVPMETRNRIERVATEMGYVPNRMAQSLGRGKSKMIGLVVAGLKNPFFAELVETVEYLLTEQGYHALIEITPEHGSQFVKCGNLSGWLLDGMIVWSNEWQLETMFERPNLYSGRVVYIGYPRTDEKDWVAFDLYGGGRLVTEHIYRSGYKKVWYLTPFEQHAIQGVEKRALAFLDVSREWGMEGRIIPLARQEGSRAVGIEMASKIARMPREARPDALICHNDYVALGVFHGLRRAGITVPKDMAVVGFDGLEEGQCLDLPLTTVRTNSSEMAKFAVEMLLKRMANPDNKPLQRLLSGELLVGETV